MIAKNGQNLQNPKISHDTKF